MSNGSKRSGYHHISFSCHINFSSNPVILPLILIFNSVFDVFDVWALLKLSKLTGRYLHMKWFWNMRIIFPTKGITIQNSILQIYSRWLWQHIAPPVWLLMLADTDCGYAPTPEGSSINEWILCSLDTLCFQKLVRWQHVLLLLPVLLSKT